MGVFCARPTMLSVAEQASGEAYTTLPLRARGQVRQLVAGAKAEAGSATRDINLDRFAPLQNGDKRLLHPSSLACCFPTLVGTRSTACRRSLSKKMEVHYAVNEKNLDETLNMYN